MLLVVARVGRAHGVKGDVLVEVRTDEPDARLAPGAVLVTDSTLDNGVEELFSPGEDFLEYRDDASMLAAIDSLLADDEKREQIGARAQKHVLSADHHRICVVEPAKTL